MQKLFVSFVWISLLFFYALSSHAGLCRVHLPLHVHREMQDILPGNWFDPLGWGRSAVGDSAGDTPAARVAAFLNQ